MGVDSKWGSVIRNIIDVLLLALVGLAVLLLHLLATPFVRGLFCDDDSIKYPYHESTVTSLALSLGVFLVPAVVICAFELTAANAWQSNHHQHCQRVPQGILASVKRYGVYLFGMGVTYLVTDMSKLMVGRLRPHFLDVCKMAEDCATTGYFTSYTCLGDPVLIEDARKAFPSGHASSAFYSAVFLIVYLHVAFRWRNPRLLRHTLQLLLLAGACAVALTRVADFKHHWGDVAAGAVLGAALAVLNVVFVSDLLPSSATSGKTQDTEPLVHEA